MSGGFPLGLAALQRDAACRAAFAQAEALARSRGETTYGVLHLLAAILTQPSETVAVALGDLEPGARLVVACSGSDVSITVR